MKRKCFTLMELMISLLLLSMLLSSLFYWYFSLQRGKKEREISSHLAVEFRYFDQQIGRILPKANLKPHFFTTRSDSGIVSGPSLVFSFDYGVQKEPLLSNTVLGRLYLDNHSHSLCLGIWPSPDSKEQSPMQTRVLLEDVEALHFDFYYPPEPSALGVNPEEVGRSKPKVGWQDEWRTDFNALPAIVRLKITKAKQERLFTYDLPLSSRFRIVFG